MIYLISINSNLSDLSNLLITQSFEANYSIAANGAIAVHIPYTVPSGYRAIGVAGYYTGMTTVFALRVSVGRMDICNVYSNAVNSKLTQKILFAKILN